MTTAKSLAGYVLATSDDAEAKSLAASVLAEPSGGGPTVHSKQDLQRILRNIDGKEGQHERAAAIRARLEGMG